MCLRFRFVAALTTLWLLMDAAPVVLAQHSPTLAELAAKEQERRSALKIRGRLITEGDLPRMPPPSTAPAPAAKATVSETPSGAAAGEAKDEPWWRQRVGQVRDELRRIEIVAEALQTQINALANDIASRDDPYQRARLADDRQKAMAELDRTRSTVDLLKKKIAEIEEEARRAGVPPGWLR